MLKSVALGGLAATISMLAVAPASAHTPQKVRYMLQDRGFYRIHFTDRYLPTYRLNACRRGKRFHLHVNFYGEVTLLERTGWCGRKRYSRRYYRGY